jgi:deoxyribodipyrimidine photo-lyase
MHGHLPLSPAPVQVVWFKRDLRVRDHWPLAEACRRGAVFPLYIIEPSVLHAADYDPCHWTFIRASLTALRAALAERGGSLFVRVGEAADVFEALRHELHIGGVWAHEETGNAITYARDRAVRRWAKAHGIAVHEYAQHGVVRPLHDRDSWAGLWEARMRQPQAPDPGRVVVPVSGAYGPLEPGPIPDGRALGLADDVRTGAQPGGELHGLALLDSFLHERGEGYRWAMSSPLTAENECSRLSPHLAFGTLSLRGVFQAALRRGADARAQGETAWSRAMDSFTDRLHWRCHFMQKLEDEPRIEFQSFIPAYDTLRAAYNPAYLDAWASGQTGYPLIDACMRALMHTGWLNFRMRALITSFASYDLFLPWQKTALARPAVWLDFEPGIHYAQFQMQSGSTGINTLRIYNPVKQSRDQDPDGVFIRRYLPELAAVPNSFIHTPWLMPAAMQHTLGVAIGRTYPAPIVEHETAAKTARDAVWALRRLPAVRAAAEAVAEKHGSRHRKDRARTQRDRRLAQPSANPRRRTPPPTPESLGQLTLF